MTSSRRSVLKVSVAAAALGGSQFVLTVFAQAFEAPPQMEVGDKWTFKFRNIADRLEPIFYTQETKAVDAASVWIFNESNRAGNPTPRTMRRHDVKRGQVVEVFVFDPSAPTGVGRRLVNLQANDDWLKFPMAVGKTYSVKETWFDGNGYNDYKAEVEAFEKVKTDAGEFDAFRIRYAGYWTRTGNGSGSGRDVMTSWYASSVKAIVKSEFVHRNPSGGIERHTNTELVKWEPAVTKSQASPAPVAAASAAK